MSACSSSAIASSVAYNDTEINWTKSFKKAFNLADKEDKVIMLYFYGKRSTWGRQFEKITYSNEFVIKKAQDFVAVKIDADSITSGAYLKRKYNVIDQPTVLFLNSDGDVLRRVSGLVEPDIFILEMDEAIRMSSIVGSIKEGDNEILEAVAYYTDKGQVDKSYELLNEIVESKTIKYFDGRSEHISSIDKNILSEYYFNIAAGYMYNRNFVKAREVFNKIIDEYQDTVYVYSADLGIFTIMRDTLKDYDMLVSYINEVALERLDLPIEYKNFYKFTLREIFEEFM